MSNIFAALNWAWALRVVSKVILGSYIVGLMPLPAQANVPVKDAAQLTKRSETSATTIKLLPVTTQRSDANKSVNCAVTTGKKAAIKDPAVQPGAGAGQRTIQPYSPATSVTPDPAARGAALSGQTLFQATGDVAGGLDASRGTLQAAQSQFGVAGQQTGTGDTVMASLDMNSAARLQNNLAWNAVTSSVNLWLTAINARNLASTGDMSRAGGGMKSGGATVVPRQCPAGMTGAGTPSDPCRASPVCQTTPPGQTPDPACVAARTTDTPENVQFYLQQFQAAAAAAANGN